MPAASVRCRRREGSWVGGTHARVQVHRPQHLLACHLLVAHEQPRAARALLGVRRGGRRRRVREDAAPRRKQSNPNTPTSMLQPGCLQHASNSLFAIFLRSVHRRDTQGFVLGWQALSPDTAGAGAGGAVVGVRIDALAQVYHLRVSAIRPRGASAARGMRCNITPRASPTTARDAPRSACASQCDHRIPPAAAHRGWRRLRVAADWKDARRTGASTWPLGDLSAASELSPASTACLRLSKSAGAIVATRACKAQTVRTPG